MFTKNTVKPRLVDPGPTHFQSHFYLLFRLLKFLKSNIWESEFYLESFYLNLIYFKKFRIIKKEIENELDRSPLTKVLRYSHSERTLPKFLNFILKTCSQQLKIQHEKQATNFHFEIRTWVPKFQTKFIILDPSKKYCDTEVVGASSLGPTTFLLPRLFGSGLNRGRTKISMSFSQYWGASLAEVCSHRRVCDFKVWIIWWTRQVNKKQGYTVYECVDGAAHVVIEHLEHLDDVGIGPILNDLFDFFDFFTQTAVGFDSAATVAVALWHSRRNNTKKQLFYYWFITRINQKTTMKKNAFLSVIFCFFFFERYWIII